MCACVCLCAAHAHTFAMCMRVFKPAVRTTALSVQSLWLDWPEQTNSVNRSVAVLESLTHQWRELPQVYVATKVSSEARVFRDKIRLVATKVCLSRQNFCRHNIVQSRNNTFVSPILLWLHWIFLSWQAYFSRDKRGLVSLLKWQILSQQTCGQTNLLHVVTQTVEPSASGLG